MKLMKEKSHAVTDRPKIIDLHVRSPLHVQILPGPALALLLAAAGEELV